MSPDRFAEVYKLIEADTSKHQDRCPSERLALAYRFLSTGESSRSLDYWVALWQSQLENG